MARPNSDFMDAIPRASLLTYFRRPQRRLHTAPPPYSKLSSSHTPLLPRIPEVDPEDLDVDEEASLGFWGERSLARKQGIDGTSHEDYNEGENEDSCSNVFYDILGFICCILLVLLLVLNLDRFLANWGSGSGLVKWGVPGVGSDGLVGREMQFCLSTPNREAPGPRTWRFLHSSAQGECSTTIATLIAGPTEEWKILPDDEVLLGDIEEPQGEEATHGKFIISGLGGNDDLGDDLAEEGQLRDRRPRKQGAGFGGR